MLGDEQPLHILTVAENADQEIMAAVCPQAGPSYHPAVDANPQAAGRRAEI